MFEAGLSALLLGEPTLSALVADRIYPILMVEGAAMPALTWQVVGGTSYPTFGTSGMQRLRVQFDCFGAGAIQAYTLRDTLRTFLNGYRGALPDGTYLQDAQYLQSIDNYNNDARQFRCALEFYFWFCFTD